MKNLIIIFLLFFYFFSVIFLSNGPVEANCGKVYIFPKSDISACPKDYGKKLRFHQEQYRNINKVGQGIKVSTNVGNGSCREIFPEEINGTLVAAYSCHQGNIIRFNFNGCPPPIMVLL